MNARLLLPVLVLAALAVAHGADAECNVLKAVVAHAPNGFAVLEGELTNNSPDGNPTQRWATVPMPGSDGCVINFHTHYYCGYPAGTDLDALTARVARCLKDAKRIDPQVFETPNGAQVSVSDEYGEVELTVEMP